MINPTTVPTGDSQSSDGLRHSHFASPAIPHQDPVRLRQMQRGAHQAGNANITLSRPALRSAGDFSDR